MTCFRMINLSKTHLILNRLDGGPGYNFVKIFVRSHTKPTRFKVEMDGVCENPRAAGSIEPDKASNFNISSKTGVPDVAEESEETLKLKKRATEFVRSGMAYPNVRSTSVAPTAEGQNVETRESTQSAVLERKEVPVSESKDFVAPTALRVPALPAVAAPGIQMSGLAEKDAPQISALNQSKTPSVLAEVRKKLHDSVKPSEVAEESEETLKLKKRASDFVLGISRPESDVRAVAPRGIEENDGTLEYKHRGLNLEQTDAPSSDSKVLMEPTASQIPAVPVEIPAIASSKVRMEEIVEKPADQISTPNRSSSPMPSVMALAQESNEPLELKSRASGVQLSRSEVPEAADKSGKLHELNERTLNFHKEIFAPNFDILAASKALTLSEELEEARKINEHVHNFLNGIDSPDFEEHATHTAAPANIDAPKLEQHAHNLERGEVPLPVSKIPVPPATTQLPAVTEVQELPAKSGGKFSLIQRAMNRIRKIGT